MTNKESSDSIGYVDSIKILDVEKRYKPGPKHYVYVIQVTWTNPTNLFIIYRRYAQFFDLQCKLLDLFADTPLPSNGNNQSRQIPFLPGKIILGRSQVRQIALERKQILDQYCQTLIALPQHISRSRPILEFFHPLSTDVQQPIESIAHEKKTLSKNSLVISEPSKLATYRCLADFTATDKLEMSLKRNHIVQVLQKHPNGWWFVQHDDRTGFVPGAYLQPSELQRGAREEKTLEKTLNEKYIVNKRYEGTGKDELSLDQGSFVTVMEKSYTGWWTIKFNDLTGQFPAIYLSSCEGRHTPENILNDTSNETSEMQKSDDSDWDEEEEDDDDERYSVTAAALSDNQPEVYYAHGDFIDNVGDCLSFKRGDLIEIHEKHSSGWWLGRRINSGHILTWMPANFLQKEQITNESIENTTDHSCNSVHYSNLFDIIPDHLIDKQKQEDKSTVSTDSIYENFESQSSTTNDIYLKVTKKQEPELAVVNKKSPIPDPPSPRVSNNQESTAKSVKDLVKRFTRQ